MTGLSVLTLVRNREDHLRHLIEGLRRSRRQPDELVVVDMSDRPVETDATAFPVHIHRFRTGGLPLAAARNRAAALATQPHLVFLDVDCIPMRDCLGRLEQEVERCDGLFCADIRYLGPDDAGADWREEALLSAGIGHALRDFPSTGVRREANPGLFWSLGFAIRAERYRALGGFDERFTGYGAEDTDFGFRADAAGVPLLFVGGAIACHQHHDSHDPPVQHLADIVANARRFREIWGRWPMEGWLAKFADMGLVGWTPERLDLIRLPTRQEIAATRVARSGDLRADPKVDHVATLRVGAP